MITIVFEDAAADRLGVLSAARPVCDLLIGAMTLVEALGRFGEVRRAPRPHLAAYLAALAGRRIAVWGGDADAGPDRPAELHRGHVALAVNARVVPHRDNLFALRTLVEAGRPCVVRADGAIAAAVFHPHGGGMLGDALPTDGLAACAVLEGLDLPAADVALAMLAEPHDIVTAHERAIEGGLALRIDGGTYREVRPGLFAADGARIPAEVVVRQGPVVVAESAEIGPFVCLDGPAWIGPHARVNPHAWVRAGTAIGRACRVGGEIEATVMEPFSNKPHDGFLGHSHVGSWVNIAAGTITSNLKATYGPVRLHGFHPDGSPLTIHTGRQFLGAQLGDFARTGINASIPCGARIGPAATISGAVPETVRAFANQLIAGDGGARSTPDQVATILERMMERRGLAILDADRRLLEALAARG